MSDDAPDQPPDRPGEDPQADGPDGDSGSGGDGERPYERVDDDRVVRTAAEAAEELVFRRFDPGEVADLDVTVTFEDGILEVDVYLNVPEPGVADPEQVADDAALTARRAVDELIAGEGER